MSPFASASRQRDEPRGQPVLSSGVRPRHHGPLEPRAFQDPPAVHRADPLVGAARLPALPHEPGLAPRPRRPPGRRRDAPDARGDPGLHRPRLGPADRVHAAGLGPVHAPSGSRRPVSGGPSHDKGACPSSASTSRASTPTWSACGGSPSPTRSGSPACRACRSRRSRTGTTRSHPRPSAWATASSATRTAAAGSARSSRCRRGRARSACPAVGSSTARASRFPRRRRGYSGPTWCPRGTRTLNIVDVGAHLLDPALSPPIKAVFISNHNPVIVHPDQNRMRRGLLRDDLFIVGADVVMTDSMAYCDVVLPASSHFARRAGFRDFLRTLDEPR